MKLFIISHSRGSTYSPNAIRRGVVTQDINKMIVM